MGQESCTFPLTRLISIPIVESISKIKAPLRAARARTRRKLLNALVKAIKKVTADDICGWFADCGYTFSLN
jgi:hypothetical protein